MTSLGRLRASGLRERYPRLATAAEALAGIAGALVVLATLAAVVGFILGPSGPVGPPPDVDFADEPAAVIADATERLSHRDFTVEEWVRTVDRRDGSVSGALFYRLHVESSRGQVRGRFQPGGPYDDPGTVGDRPPHEVFVAGGAGWFRLRGVAYWQRSPPAVNLTRDALAFTNVSRDRLAAANVTVVRDNASAYVAVAESPLPDGPDRIRYVIAKGENPHLRQVWYVRASRFETRTRVVRVLNYGEATAPRPADVPWTTVAELRGRVARGLDRLV